MKLSQIAFSLVAASVFSLGLMAAETAKPAAAPAGAKAKCCVTAEKDGHACAHQCCVDAAKAGHNCEKCGGTNEKK